MSFDLFYSILPIIAVDLAMLPSPKFYSSEPDLTDFLEFISSAAFLLPTSYGKVVLSLLDPFYGDCKNIGFGFL